MGRVRRLAAAALVAGLSAVACGGGDGDTGGASPSPSNAANGGVSGGEPGGASGGGGSGGSGSGAGALTSAECVATALQMSQAAAAVGTALTGTNPDYARTITQLEAFANAAPSEIRADMGTVVGGYASIARVLADANYNPASGQPPSSAVLASLQTATESLDTQAFRGALDRVDNWFAQRCGR